MKKLLVTAICFMLVLSLGGCKTETTNALYANENEIKLKIQLDLKENIGLFLIESDIDGQTEIGGTSNADKSMIRHDDVIYWTLDKQHYENAPDSFSLSLRFSVVTKYFEPIYGNDYPEEYKEPLDEISFPAQFGEVYCIRITGDKAGGYQAFLEQE